MEIIKQVEGFVSGKINIAKTVFSIMKLEAKLAGLSIFPLILNLFMLFIVLITLWVSVMLVIGYFAVLIFANYFAAIALILLINLGLFLGLLKYLSFNLKNMSFERTRAYFAQNESKDHDKLEESSDSPNRVRRKRIKVSTK